MNKDDDIRYHREKLQELLSIRDQIYHEILLESLEYETAKILKDTSLDSVIAQFQGTFLSNFYAVPIVYGDRMYPSVEHAYQHQKFSQHVPHSLNPFILEKIQEAVRTQGYGFVLENVDALFSSLVVNAYTIKIVADVLRNNGYEKQDWVDERVRVMIELLLLKFSDEEMRRRLSETEGKLLVEGNDWRDTLWGFCEGQGRNLLGRILMNIREKQKASLL